MTGIALRGGGTTGSWRSPRKKTGALRKARGPRYRLHQDSERRIVAEVAGDVIPEIELLNALHLLLIHALPPGMRIALAQLDPLGLPEGMEFQEIDFIKPWAFMKSMTCWASCSFPYGNDPKERFARPESFY